MNIIFNADDFGITDPVSASIIELMERTALLKSTTVMINLLSDKALTAALEFLRHKNEKEYSFGLHFNLTCGRPVLPQPKVASLVETDGTFLKFERIVKKITENRVVLSEIEAEFFAQAEKFTKMFGFPPSHVDSHKHMHCLPGVMNCILKSFVAFGLERMRLPAGFSGTELFTSQGIPTGEITPYFEKFDCPLDSMPEKFGIARLKVRRPSAFFGTYTVGKLSPEVFAKETDGHVSSKIAAEYMCHPGTVDDFLRKKSGLLEPREAERDALGSAELKRKAAELGFVPASFFSLDIDQDEAR